MNGLQRFFKVSEEIAEYYKLRGTYPKLEYVVKILRNPYFIFKSLRRRRRIAKFVNALTTAPIIEIDQYLQEIVSKRDFRSELCEKLTYFEDKRFTSGAPLDPLGAILYTIVRALKPDNIVETGVASGLSSAYILLALEQNGQGRLYSIDLPFEEGKIYEDDYHTPEWGVVPKGKQSGWVIPGGLRHRWNLILGLSSENLSPLLTQLNSIDIFLHDSEHSYENMMREYQTAYPFIKPGGILLSHDIHYNDAFSNFCHLIRSKYLALYDMGGLRKPF